MHTRTLVVLLLVAYTVVATNYDYVIIGGGVAGSIVANRLATAFPRANIAIIEAGDNQTANPLVSQPSRAFSQTSTNLRYNWFADAEPLFNNQKLLVQQGRMFGGGSGANQYAYERSLPSDYEAWANAVGDSSWNYQNVLPLYKRSEKASAGLSPVYHGRNGPLNVVESLTTCTFAQAWIGVAGELNQPSSSDLNGAQPTGFGFEQSTIDPTTLLRDDANTAFLTPASKSRKVTIFKNTSVTKILLRNQGRKQKAYGVLAIDPIEGELTIRGKQIIVSAGALSTPGLLMRSGIGSPAKLSPHGIESVVPLSGVGENLIDNYSFIVSYSGTVGACTFPTRPVLHLNTTQDAFIIANPRATSISFVIMNPKHDSRGSVNLNSASPFDVPKITLNIKDSFFDNMLSSINLVRQITSSATFRSAFPNLLETAPGAAAQTTAALRTFIAANIGFAPHFAGTCKMGKESDSSAVVDSKFRVFGVEGLRVIDSSVVPIMTRNGMYAIATLVGEKGAQAIIDEDN